MSTSQVPMHFDFISVLPEMFAPVLQAGVVGRAAQQGGVSFRVVPLRAFATGRHRITDLAPYGGGPGMVLKPEPLVRAIRWASSSARDVAAPPVDAVDFPGPAERSRAPRVRVILMDAGGQPFTQALARELASTVDHVVFACGRYEGIDERVMPEVDLRLSVGPYVLTGGELPALLVADAVARLVPGTLGNPDSAGEESHESGLLEYPHFTRPPEFEGRAVPPELISGHHEQVRKWRRTQSLLRTRAERPDLWTRFTPSAEDQALLDAADGKPLPARRRRRSKAQPT